MHVLLVEDNQADVELLTELFSEHQDHVTLHLASDGSQALDYVCQKDGPDKEPRPDVIMLDLGLPRISGYDVLRQIKNDPQYSAIPTIVLTTSCTPLDREQCRSLGADMFFSKPHDLKGYQELVERLTSGDFKRLVGADTRKAG